MGHSARGVHNYDGLLVLLSSQLCVGPCPLRLSGRVWREELSARSKEDWLSQLLGKVCGRLAGDRA